MPRVVRRAARVAGTTAVVAGTAGAVQHHQNKKYAENAQEDAAEQQSAYEQGVADAQAAAPQQVPPAPAAAPQDDMTAQLEQLAKLKNEGVITEEEFQAKKKQILGI